MGIVKVFDVTEEGKEDGNIDNFVSFEVDRYSTNLNWSQFESITKLELTDEVINGLLEEAL